MEHKPCARREGDAYVMAATCRMGRAGGISKTARLQLGDGIYEVANVTDGKTLDEEPHLDRMETVPAELACPCDGPAALKLVMREYDCRNRIPDGYLYRQVTRGAASATYSPR